MDITIKRKKLLVQTLTTFLLCAIIFIASWLTWRAAQGLRGSAAQSEVFASQLSVINLQIAQTEKAIDENKIKLTSATNDEYMLLLGELAASCGVSITKLQTAPPAQNINVTSTLNKIEVQGSLDKIILFQQNVTAQRAAKIINISLRQDNELLWLARDFDNINILPWLAFDEVDESAVIAEEPIPVLPDLSQLVNQTDMLCYLEIAYYN